MALLDDLATQMTSPFLDTDVNWKQFVYDHRMYLRIAADRVYATGERLAQCQGNIERWLREDGYDPTTWWIVLLINGLPNEISFDQGLADIVIYVPTSAQMNALYLSYITTSTNRVTNPIGQ